MLRRLLLTTAALVAAVVAYAWVTAPPRRIALAPPASNTIVFGAYHVHTTHSDGAFTPDEVADAARRAQLSFVILTDHGDGTRAPDPPHYVNGVLMIDAAEVSAVEGHIVALGLPGATPYRLGGEARDIVEDIHRLGGFAIAAHPDSPRPDLRWRPTPSAPGGGRAQPNDLAGADGMEWLNADSEWRDEGPLRVAQTLINFPVRPSESLARLMARPTASLRRWDALTRRRPLVALGAADAHGIGGHFYSAILGTLAQGVEMAAAFSGDATVDARALLTAVRRGRTWTVINAFAGPAAVHLTAHMGTESAAMGEALTVSGAPVEIFASVDGAPNARVALWHDDREVASGIGRASLQTPGEPGAYRAEVSLAGFAMPWIVTNPIYLVGPTGPVAPTPGPAPARDEIVTPLSPMGDWSIEHGPSSEGAVVREADGLRFQFRVGTVRPGLEYSALARSMGDSLESFDRIEFIGSASAPMRVLVQFRLPGGVDGERWSRSVYLDPTPRAVTVRLTDVMPVGFQAMRRPVVARVRSILFVLDTLNTAPGTRGDVLLKDVRLARGRQASGTNREQQVRRPGQK